MSRRKQEPMQFGLLPILCIHKGLRPGEISLTCHMYAFVMSAIQTNPNADLNILDKVTQLTNLRFSRKSQATLTL